MSDLRHQFNDALSLIDGQHYFVATVTPRSFFTAADAQRRTLKAGATVTRNGDQVDCSTVIAAPGIHNRLSRYLRLARPVELAVQYEGKAIRILGLAPTRQRIAA